MSKKSRFSGKTPNTKWRYFTDEEVSTKSCFLTLPSSSRITSVFGENKSFPSHLVPQRSPEWFELRKGRVTGSRIAPMLGFHESKTMKFFGKRSGDHNRVVDIVNDFCFDKYNEPSSQLRTIMDWGVHHESNAVFTFLKAYPEFGVKETGLWKCPETKYKNLPPLGASPDGIVIKLPKNMKQGTSVDYFDKDEEIEAVLEIKCPTAFLPSKNDTFRYKKRVPHDTIPHIYLPQIFSQMFVTGIAKCYFVSWTVTAGTNVFEVEFDEGYVDMILKFIERFNVEYLSKKKVPERNWWGDDKEYEKLLIKTKEIIDKCKVVKFVKNSMKSEKEVDMFLDDRESYEE